MSNETKEEKLIKEIIYSLVDKKEEVSIDITLTGHTAVYDIRVADSDVGKVLGKKGGHAAALRTIFSAIYGKMGKKLHLQVVDPRRSKSDK